ncbi:MAG: PQQ-dependent sugar dehydrogenase [Thermoproteota archaeon]|nr:PQQ-dependent sugar dehydrogenase [Thermoproteota archaeon]
MIIAKEPPISVTLVMLLAISLLNEYNLDDASARPKVSPQGPTINDSALKAELVSQGLKAPTSMLFLGPNDILVTEKNSGLIQRIVNGTTSNEPLAHVNVSKADERGLLGMALSSTKTNGPVYVFLYYTKSQTEVNNVYRYELVNDKLTNPKLLLDLPALPGPQHNGGKITIGPDKSLYIAIGDVGGSFVEKDSETKAQNYVNGSEPDGRAAIIRITQDGKPIGNGIIGSVPISNLYYAYGIKNIFGLDFDPVTGKLWNTENGPTFGDEINLVEPGFNSGWAKVQGVWFVQSQEGEKTEPGKGERAPENPQGLVGFGGKGKYSPPEFTWDRSVAPTALKFLSSSKLGAQYANDMFVGDAKFGNIYHFVLNKNRTGLSLEGPLADKVADKIEELGNTIFGKGFGVITDLQVGPDGYLYVLVYDKDDGRVYRILPV